MDDKEKIELYYFYKDIIEALRKLLEAKND